MFSFRDFDLPINKELLSSLQFIKGVGFHKALLVSSKVGFSYPFFVGNLNFYKFSLLAYLLKYLVLSVSRINRFIMLRINDLKVLRTFKGCRHRDFLPVRGQRTRSNAGVRIRIRRSGRRNSF